MSNGNPVLGVATWNSTGGPTDFDFIGGRQRWHAFARTTSQECRYALRRIQTGVLAEDSMRRLRPFEDTCEVQPIHSYIWMNCKHSGVLLRYAWNTTFCRLNPPGRRSDDPVPGRGRCGRLRHDQSGKPHNAHCNQATYLHAQRTLAFRR